jgi:hypothetical protein
MPWIKNLRGEGGVQPLLTTVVPGNVLGTGYIDEAIQRETDWLLEQIDLGEGGYLARAHSMSDECG